MTLYVTVGIVTVCPQVLHTPAHLPLNVYRAGPWEMGLPGVPLLRHAEQAQGSWVCVSARQPWVPRQPDNRLSAVLFSSHAFPQVPVPRGLQSLSATPASPCHGSPLSLTNLGFLHPACRPQNAGSQATRAHRQRKTLSSPGPRSASHLPSQ